MMICLDANCLIYLIEGNPIWNQKIVARLVRAKAIGDTVGVCDLVRAECLIGPLKEPVTVGFWQTINGFFPIPLCKCCLSRQPSANEPPRSVWLPR